MISEINDRFYHHCPICGRFLTTVLAKCHGDKNDPDIDEVTGICQIHGEQKITDWERTEFFPDSI